VCDVGAVGEVAVSQLLEWADEVVVESIPVPGCNYSHMAHVLHTHLHIHLNSSLNLVIWVLL
jgi:hypothetical protein